MARRTRVTQNIAPKMVRDQRQIRGGNDIGKEMYVVHQASSYLALDVYFLESGGTQGFEKGRDVTDFHLEVCAVLLVGLLFDTVLSAVGF